MKTICIAREKAIHGLVRRIKESSLTPSTMGMIMMNHRIVSNGFDHLTIDQLLDLERDIRIA